MASSVHRRRPLTVVLALTASMALSSSGLAHAQSDDLGGLEPAEAAAAWLVDTLVDGERIQSEFEGNFFDAPGATADTVLALGSVGVAGEAITAATDWLETQADTYSGAGDDVTTGAIGKLLLTAAATERDPRDFGGVDLVAKVGGAEVTDPDTDDPADLPGRYRDVGEFGDFSSPLTHALVLLGLERTDGITPSDEAVALLLAQQCDDGGFSEAFLVSTDEDPTPDCSSSVDTTGYAAQTLHALGEEAALADAVDWLEGVQSADGSFGSADGQNTNSAGLAAVALALGDGDRDAIAAARSFIADVQDGCDSDSPGAIPFNADERGFVALATAQSVPGLVGVGLGTVSAAGASASVPEFDCADDADTGDTRSEPRPDASTGSEEPTDRRAETPQPSRVDSGISPSSPPASLLLAGLALVGGLGLLVLGLVGRGRPAPTSARRGRDAT